MTFTFIKKWVRSLALMMIGASTLYIATCQADLAFDQPMSIAFQNFGNVTYAYVANAGNNQIAKCTVDPSTGALSGCTNAGATGLNSPVFIAVQRAPNGTTYAYVIDNQIHPTACTFQCAINAEDGTFSGCQALASHAAARPPNPK